MNVATRDHDAPGELKPTIRRPVRNEKSKNPTSPSDHLCPDEILTIFKGCSFSFNFIEEKEKTP